jgi:hypothetical protein
VQACLKVADKLPDGGNFSERLIFSAHDRCLWCNDAANDSRAKWFQVSRMARYFRRYHAGQVYAPIARAYLPAQERKERSSTQS